MRRWVEYSDKLIFRQDTSEIPPFTDHRGALGKLARMMELMRKYLVDQAREPAEAKTRAGASEAARKTQEDAIAAYESGHERPGPVTTALAAP